MATYYVDATGGLDTNDGLSEGAAWQTLTKLNATTFSAGDTVNLKAGETWMGKWTVLGSGTSGSLITITNYGTGALPIIDATGQTAAIYMNGNDYITIDGIDARNATSQNISGAGTTDSITVTNCSVSGGSHAIWFTTGTGITISNNTITQTNGGYGIVIQQATAVNPVITENTLTGGGTGSVYGTFVAGSGATFTNNTANNWQTTVAGDKVFHFNSASGATVSGNTCTGCEGNNFYFSSCTNMTLSGTNTSTNSGNVGFNFNSGSGYSATGSLIVNSSTGRAFWFTNLTGTNTLAAPQVNGAGNTGMYIDGSAITINDPVVHDVTASDAIWIVNASTVALNDVDIQDITATSAANGVHSDGGTTTITGGTIARAGVDCLTSDGTSTVTAKYVRFTGCGNTSNATSGDGATAHDSATLHLEYDIFDNNYKSGAAFVQNSTGSVKNCTFYNNYEATIAGNYGLFIDTAGAVSWEVKNNIFKHHENEIYISAAAIAAGLVLDSDYNVFDDSRGGNAFHYNGTDYDFSGYQTASSQDANSINEDPLFINPEGADFKLLDRSPAIIAGTNLSLTRDFDGVAVPKYGTTPTVGAHEYTGTLIFGNTGVDKAQGTTIVYRP